MKHFKHNQGIRSFKVFLLMFGMGLIMIIPFLIQSKGFFTLANDFNYQQIPFNMYCIDAIRSGNVLWDWNTDLGGNFLGNYAFYTLGSPFFWLLSLFPSSVVPYLLGPMMALKYGVAGLTAYWYLRRYTQGEKLAVFAAILYAFSGFQAGNTLFNHFHDAVAFFPLLLIGLDKLTQENKKGWFALAVALNATTNYFFFAGEVIFLGIYFLIRVVWDNRQKFKTIGYCLLEGVLGVGLSCFIFYPALLFTLQNPRVSSHVSGVANFVFGDSKQYIRLLKSFLLPMEAMTSNSSVDVYVFSSTSLYLPMVGIMLVLCFVLSSKEFKWIRRILVVCGIIVLIPVLNSSFYAWNASYSYYTRWLYMPILIMALASLKALEMEKLPMKRVIVIIGALFFLLVIVLVNPFGESYLLRKTRVLIQFSIAVSGLIITAWLLSIRKSRLFTRLLIAGTAFFAVLTNCYTMYVMRDTAPVIHSTDGVKAFHEAAENITIDDPAQDWRTIFSNKKGNIPILMNVPSVSNWNSTVSGEIFKFYNMLGMEREFDSPGFSITCEPAKALLSVKYEILSSEETTLWKGENQKKKFLAEFNTSPFNVKVYERGFGIGDYKEYTNEYKFYLYENENFIPIGFAYNAYITEDEFLKLPVEQRPYALLRAVVLSEEDSDNEIVKTLRHLGSEELSNLDDAHMGKDIELRRNMSSRNFTHDTASFNSKITSDQAGVAFFSVPFDSSWRATVNGQTVNVLNTSGFMSVPVTAGENNIEFHYLAMDNRIGFVLTLVSAIGFSLHIFISRRKNA